MPVRPGDLAADVQGKRHLNVDAGHIGRSDRNQRRRAVVGGEARAAVEALEIDARLVAELQRVGAGRHWDGVLAIGISLGPAHAVSPVLAGADTDVRQRLPVGSGDRAADLVGERQDDVYAAGVAGHVELSGGVVEDRQARGAVEALGIDAGAVPEEGHREARFNIGGGIGPIGSCVGHLTVLPPHSADNHTDAREWCSVGVGNLAADVQRRGNHDPAFQTCDRGGDGVASPNPLGAGGEQGDAEGVAAGVGGGEGVVGRQDR